MQYLEPMFSPPRRAVEVVECDERKRSPGPKVEASGERRHSPPAARLFPRRLTADLTPLFLPLRAGSRVSLPQVARVLSEVYGDRMASQSGGGGASDGESFPLQQKLLVCCLLLLTRQGKSKEVVLGKVSRQ